MRTECEKLLILQILKLNYRKKLIFKFRLAVNDVHVSLFVCLPIFPCPCYPVPCLFLCPLSVSLSPVCFSVPCLFQCPLFDFPCPCVFPCPPSVSVPCALAHPLSMFPCPPCEFPCSLSVFPRVCFIVHISSWRIQGIVYLV